MGVLEIFACNILSLIFEASCVGSIELISYRIRPLGIIRSIPLDISFHLEFYGWI